MTEYDAPFFNMSEKDSEIRPVSKRVLASVMAEAKYTLQYMADTGCRGFDCSKETLEILKHLGEKKAVLADTLETIQKNMENCRRCRLCNGRKHIVYGSGNPRARLVFVGGAPSYEEDQTGEPFSASGEAGQMLTRIIQAIKMRREDVYLCNIIKCRPPKDRLPKPDEIRTCLPFTERQLAVLKPEFICAMGEAAVSTLLNTEIPIEQLRGRFHDYKGIRLVPTYHPEFLLQNTDKKRDTWEDMKMLMREMLGSEQ